MSQYLNNFESLQGKKVACFVTQFFPYPWMGGNNAIKQMSGLCEKKGAIISGTGVVNWKNKRRENMIEDVVEKFSKLV
jgi:hypothetical protein